MPLVDVINTIEPLTPCAFIRSAIARVLMKHSAPADIAEYARTFDPLPIEFGAAFSGFAFDATCLDTPLVGAKHGVF